MVERRQGGQRHGKKYFALVAPPTARHSGLKVHDYASLEEQRVIEPVMTLENLMTLTQSCADACHTRTTQTSTATLSCFLKRVVANMGLRSQNIDDGLVTST